VLTGFASPADAALVDDIDRTWGRFKAAAKSTVKPELARLLAALGLTS
jgi:hypothetical protein